MHEWEPITVKSSVGAYRRAIGDGLDAGSMTVRKGKGSIMAARKKGRALFVLDQIFLSEYAAVSDLRSGTHRTDPKSGEPPVPIFDET